MANAHAPELFWLAATTLLTGILWVPYIINRFLERGPPGWSWFPLPDPPPRARWALRAVQAHANAVENLVLFAPTVLTFHAIGATVVAVEACRIYFFARLAHAVALISGLPTPFRTITFMVGFACQMTLVVAILSKV